MAWRVLREFVKRYPRQADAAKALGVNPSYVWDMLKHNRVVGPRVLRKLGLRRVVVSAA